METRIGPSGKLLLLFSRKQLSAHGEILNSLAYTSLHLLLLKSSMRKHVNLAGLDHWASSIGDT